MSVRFKRIIAFIIDWNISLLPYVIIVSFLASYLKQQPSINPVFAIIFLLIFILALGSFILRDIIFQGRSLGKRIFGLYIYDKETLEQSSEKQRFLRNIFLILYIFDGIVLIATGRTIGDRVAGTLVISERDRERSVKQMQFRSPISKKKRAKKTIIILAIIMGCLVAFIGLIQIILDTQKDTEEYKVAYSYFVQSDAYKKLNVDETKIRFNQYSSHTYTSTDGKSVSQTVEIGFMVNFKSYEVVCHKENNSWQVCSECTLFK